MSYLPSKLPDTGELTELEPWRKALLKAAERLRVHGHCKGSFNIGGDRPSCAAGAILSVTDDFETRIRATRAAEAQIGNASLIGWNDAPDTTAEMVIAALTAAARAP